MASRLSSSGLEDAIRKILLAWEHTKPYWSDAKALQFERKYLESLPVLGSSARDAVDELDKIMRKIQTDCE